jgi:hypothetical protein
LLAFKSLQHYPQKRTGSATAFRGMGLRGLSACRATTCFASRFGRKVFAIDPRGVVKNKLLRR